MKSKIKAHRVALFAVIGSIMAMLLLVVGAWAYDNSQKDQIASGVTIGGVDVGGRDADEARQIVKTQVVGPLQRPVIVNYGDQHYRLTASQLKQHADIDGMVDEAVEASREGGILARVGRYVAGGEVDEDIPTAVSYSEKSVDTFVEEIAEDVNKDPVDASVTPSGDSLSPVPGEPGVELRDGKLTALVTAKIESPIGGRSVAATVRKTQPEVTTAELAQAYPTYVTIDRAGYTLRLFKNLKLDKSYPIAVGQAGLETPAGPLPRPGQAGEPLLVRARVRLGGRSGGHRGAAGPEQPAAGALDRHLQRRRHPRHHRHRLARVGRIPRLRAHVGSRRHRSLRPGPDGDPDLRPVAPRRA